MAKFNFYQDVKCEMWNRQHFTIEAESEEQANEIAKMYKDKDTSILYGDKNIELGENEWLYDTSDIILPEENDNQPTFCTLNDNGEEICNNGIK